MQNGHSKNRKKNLFTVSKRNNKSYNNNKSEKKAFFSLPTMLKMIDLKT